VSVSKAIIESMSNKTASVIRKMFEEGVELKKKYGEDAVCDFSLGNPDLDPPAAVIKAIRAQASREEKGSHGYMPNAGYYETRAAMAKKVSGEQGIDVSAENIVMTCGAAAALNCVLKALLEPGDEVSVLAPYFPEYNHYAANHGGTVRAVPTATDFSPDIAAIQKALSTKTCALIVNSPNNPTGKV
jgi:aspartate aminotransferase